MKWSAHSNVLEFASSPYSWILEIKLSYQAWTFLVHFRDFYVEQSLTWLCNIGIDYTDDRMLREYGLLKELSYYPYLAVWLTVQDKSGFP